MIVYLTSILRSVCRFENRPEAEAAYSRRLDQSQQDFSARGGERTFKRFYLNFDADVFDSAVS